MDLLHLAKEVCGQKASLLQGKAEDWRFTRCTWTGIQFVTNCLPVGDLLHVLWVNEEEGTRIECNI